MLIISVTCGPDQVKHTEKLYTANPEEAVKLKIPSSGKAIETIAPVSIPSVLKRMVKNYGDHPALCYKEENAKTWTEISYRYRDTKKVILVKTVIL